MESANIFHSFQKIEGFGKIDNLEDAEKVLPKVEQKIIHLLDKIFKKEDAINSMVDEERLSNQQLEGIALSVSNLHVRKDPSSADQLHNIYNRITELSDHIWQKESSLPNIRLRHRDLSMLAEDLKEYISSTTKEINYIPELNRIKEELLNRQKSNDLKELEEVENEIKEIDEMITIINEHMDELDHREKEREKIVSNMMEEFEELRGTKGQEDRAKIDPKKDNELSDWVIIENPKDDRTAE